MLLFTMAMCCGEVARCLEVLSRWWPSLLPRCNTAYGLIRQADLIEILMSTLRGTSLLFADSELKTLREVSRQTRFQELCSLMQTVHLLKARLTDGYLKHKKETIRRCVHNACVYPSPPAHHRCGYNRTMCTSRPRHTVAVHVRLQPHYACILLPMSLCNTGGHDTGRWTNSRLSGKVEMRLSKAKLSQGSGSTSSTKQI